MNSLGGRRGAAVGVQGIRAARNAFAARVLDRQAVLPFMAVYHVNYACNAACSFCSRAFDLSVHSTSGNAASLERKREVLDGIREFAPSIYFTGGEPLLDSEIEEALEYAHGIGFFPITVNTNASVLHHRQGVLRVADNVVVSLHSVDERRLAKILRVSPAVARRTLRNTIEAAALGRSIRARVVANCVVTTENLGEVPAVVDFCLQNGIALSVVPAIIDHEPEPQLMAQPMRGRYERVIDSIIHLKRIRPSAVVSSLAYLERIRDFGTFACRPTSIVVISPQGDVLNPCDVKYSHLPRVLGRIGPDSGLAQILRSHVDYSARFTTCEKNCLKACHVEPAMAIEAPLAALREIIRNSL